MLYTRWTRPPSKLTPVSTYDSLRAPIGTARSSSPRIGDRETILYSHANVIPTSPIWPVLALLESPDRITPQFATRNSHTVAWVTQIAGQRPVEFQRLHGMGEALYEALHDNIQALYVPRLCTNWRAQCLVALPRPAPAREWRELIVRPSDRGS